MDSKPEGKGRGKRFLKILLKIIGVLVLINALVIAVGSILRATYFEKRYREIEPYGELFDVYDGKMHVYSMGEGDRTIVLLPGMGVALPSAEFGPLMRKLSGHYRIVALEYFGVGFSGVTSRERSCENYVGEIRAALAAAHVPAPYILMPHSISSVYSEYYACKYPEEIEAIISLDGTSTAYSDKPPENIKTLLKIGLLQQKSGFSSLMAKLAANKRDLLSKNYTEKEIDDMVMFCGFSLNDTVIDQISLSTEFITQAMELEYPESVPYMKIISKKTYETPNRQLKTTPQEYQMNHLARIGKNAKFEVLDGSHFIYLGNEDRIAEITDIFLGEVESK